MFYKGPRPIKYDGNILMAINGLYNGRYYDRSILGTANYGGVYYVNGDPATGVYNGNYYVNGVYGTGTLDGIYYLNGKSTSDSDFPSTISGLNLWLDGADNTQILQSTTDNTAYSTNGSAVKRWLDKSGMNNHLANSAITDVDCRYETNSLNGKSVVCFPSINGGASRLLEGSSTSAFNFMHQGYTTSEVFCVFFTDLQQQHNSFDIFSTGSLGSNGIKIFYQATPSVVSPSFQAQVFKTNPTAWVSQKAAYNYSSAYNNFVLYHVKSSPGNTPGDRMEYYINNVSGGGSDPRNATFSEGDAGTVLKLGGPAAVRNYGQVKYAEMLVFNQALTSNQRTAIYSYLKNKWGLSYTF